MTCEDWQNLILTDYLDDQMDPDDRKGLEGHLSSCQQCRDFALNARKAVIEPFTNAQKAEPSEEVWHNIKDAISETEELPEFVGLWGRIKELVYIPRPAMAFATIIILFLGVTVTFNFRHQQFQIAKSALTQSQIDDVSYALDELAYLTEEDDLYGVTELEEYFL